MKMNSLSETVSPISKGVLFCVYSRGYCYFSFILLVDLGLRNKRSVHIFRYISLISASSLRILFGSAAFTSVTSPKGGLAALNEVNDFSIGVFSRAIRKRFSGHNRPRGRTIHFQRQYRCRIRVTRSLLLGKGTLNNAVSLWMSRTICGPRWPGNRAEN